MDELACLTENKSLGFSLRFSFIISEIKAFQKAVFTDSTNSKFKIHFVVDFEIFFPTSVPISCSKILLP
jgi:hypothetical protein